MKTVPTVALADTSEAPGLQELPDEVRLALTDIAGAAREGLLALSVAAGMAVMQAMLEAEVESLAGPKGKHDPDRTATRHGVASGSVTLGGRRVPATRPRVRTTDGHEVPLATYGHFAADDLLTGVVMERMLAGVATRRHARVAEPIGEEATKAAKSTSKSAVSRRFIKQTETALAELITRDLSETDVKVLMLDGEHMAERCVVVALAITADGTKRPVGLWDGSTENKTVVTSLLSDLVARGLSFEDGLLVVLDGAKALAAGVREVFGDKALVQRCTLHKRRNVADHLPEKDKEWVDAKLVKAFGHADPEQGLRNAKRLAGLLDKTHPGAAASLREGLEEMFTVSRLGIDGRLAKTLTTSNPVESMISIARTTNRNVTRWRDGQMVLRWTAAGMLNAERSFRRIKGYKQMPQLVAALHRHAHPHAAVEDVLDAREQAAAIDGIRLGPLRTQPPRPDGERDRFWQWVDDETPATQVGSSLRRTVEHIQTFRDAADELDVVHLHYQDLQADLEGQMRQLAARLVIDVDEHRWPRLVQAATFESMRSRADTTVPGGGPEQWIDPAAFFSRGTSGQWRDLLDDVDLARYATRVRTLAADALVGWVHREAIAPRARAGRCGRNGRRRPPPRRTPTWPLRWSVARVRSCAGSSGAVAPARRSRSSPG